MSRSRKLAAVLASGGLGIGLLGAGTYAQFSDSASAADTVNVGTFGIVLHSDTQGVQGNDSKALSLSGPTLLSSVAGSRPLSFKVVNTGSIDAIVTITPQDTLPGGEFTDMLAGAPIQVTVPANSISPVYAGGIQWGELTNASLGKTEQVKYVITAVDHQ